jgi:hypothetical protein
LARRFTPQPPRDLFFLDSLAVIVALFVGYAFWAATKAAYPMSWGGIWPLVRHALPVTVLAAILSCASLGLYGAAAARAGLREHAAAAGSAAAIAVVVAAWYGGDTPPLAAVVPGVLAAAALIHFGRRLYWRVAGDV